MVRNKSVCVSTLSFECAVRGGGMGVCVERQMCVCVCVERLSSVFAHVGREDQSTKGLKSR